MKLTLKMIVSRISSVSSGWYLKDTGSLRWSNCEEGEEWTSDCADSDTLVDDSSSISCNTELKYST